MAIPADSIRRAIRIGLPLLVVLAAASVVVFGARAGVLEALASLEWWGVAGALALAAVSAVGEGFAFAIIEGDVGPRRVMQMTRAYLAGGFVAFITPYSTGGAPAWAWAVSREGTAMGTGAGVVTARSVVVTVFFGLMVTLVAVLGPLVSGVSGGIMVAVLVPLAVTALAVMIARNPHRAGTWAARFCGALAHRTGGRRLQAIADGADREVAEFSATILGLLRRPAALLAALLAVGVSRFSQMLAMPLLLLAQGFRLTLAEAMLAAVVVWVITSLTPTPSGEGVAQAAVIGVFGTLATSPAAAATALVWRATVYYPVFLLGGILFARLVRHAGHG